MKKILSRKENFILVRFLNYKTVLSRSVEYLIPTNVWVKDEQALVSLNTSDFISRKVGKQSCLIKNCCVATRVLVIDCTVMSPVQHDRTIHFKWPLTVLTDLMWCQGSKWGLAGWSPVQSLWPQVILGGTWVVLEIKPRTNELYH